MQDYKLRIYTNICIPFLERISLGGCQGIFVFGDKPFW